jgi:glycosyltransferase involved in cell wall biosynthesis
MRILFITENLRSGGKERRLVELLKGLSKFKEIKCELAIMSKEIHYTGIYNLEVKIHYLIRKNKKDPRIFFKLYKLCKEFKPDIIHSWGSMPSVYAFPIAKVLKIKFINAMISDAPLKLKVFSKTWIRSKLTFPFSDIILSNSYAGLKSYNAPKNKNYCIHNGFDFERLKKIEDKENVKSKFGIETDKVVGMVASFSDKKDYTTYIKAANTLLQRRNDITFLAIGDGINLQKCKGMFKNGFQNRIKFLGKQSDVESLINIFDVGVLSTYTEGISNVVMEYMALGKPVIVSSGGGTPEIVEHDKTGFLISPKSVEELASKIEYLLENEKVAVEMGEKGRERIRQEFSLEKMTNSFVSSYKRLLNQRI